MDERKGQRSSMRCDISSDVLTGDAQKGKESPKAKPKEKKATSEIGELSNLTKHLLEGRLPGDDTTGGEKLNGSTKSVGSSTKAQTTNAGRDAEKELDSPAPKEKGLTRSSQSMNDVLDGKLSLEEKRAQLSATKKWQSSRTPSNDRTVKSLDQDR